ncbi:uncharacterized protein LOC116805835 [Drosophila grimshawi]|uniref:uncharacterized protein LOC116805835 n=1 Tax=Drosophila grimshawi TaxID=7222 RepID=UPI000C871384|nr:uncharacterized protein LOC116805835 [Drosophila grimshawi]
MSPSMLLVISVLVCLHVLAFGQEGSIEKFLERSQQAEQAVSLALEKKLPPSSEARREGAEILATLNQGLKTCDQQLRSNGLVGLDAYNTCVSSLQGLAMASIGELAGQHWAKSGASRPTLFW